MVKTSVSGTCNVLSTMRKSWVQYLVELNLECIAFLFKWYLIQNVNICKVAYYVIYNNHISSNSTNTVLAHFLAHEPIAEKPCFEK